MLGDFLRFIFTGPFHLAKVMERRENAIKETATFLVIYEDGQRGPETVVVGTPRYNVLMDLTDQWESLLQFNEVERENGKC